MPRILLGFNRLFTIRRPVRAVTASGSSSEAFTTIATNVPGTIQAHVLSNLPAPPQRPKAAGQFRMDEFRLWLGDPVNSANAQLDDIIDQQGTSPLQSYRVMAVLDDAGRDHHQYLRVESYSQESQTWVQQGGEPT